MMSEEECNENSPGAMVNCDGETSLVFTRSANIGSVVQEQLRFYLPLRMTSDPMLFRLLVEMRVC